MTPFVIFTIIVLSLWGKCTVCLKDFNQCCLKLFWMESTLASIYYVSQCIFPFIFLVNETITVLWGGWHFQVHRVKKFKNYQKNDIDWLINKKYCMVWVSKSTFGFFASDSTIRWFDCIWFLIELFYIMYFFAISTARPRLTRFQSTRFLT